MQNLLSETCDNAERGNNSDGNSIFPPLISEEEMDDMSSGDEYDAEPMYTEMLKYIRDGSQFHLSVNMSKSHYKIHDHIKRSQVEYEGALLSTQNMDKGLNKVFKALVNEILRVLPIFVNLDHNFNISFHNLETFQK